MLASFLCREFLLHIPCCGYCFCCCFCLFVVVFIWGVSLTHLMLFKTSKQKTGGSFSYISRAGFFSFLFFFFFFSFFFVGGLSLTHLVLASFLSGKFLLHTQWWLHFSAGFLLHIPCRLHFYLGSFSYISDAGFFSFSSVEFLLHIPCWLLFLWVASQVCSLLWRQPLKKGAGFLMWGDSFACSLEAGGCFILGSYGCAYHTNCLSKQNKKLKKKINNK